MKRFPDRVNIVCCVCLRHAIGVGEYVGRGRNAPIAWICESASCRASLKKVVTMSGRDLDRDETLSLVAAGDVAGDYLQRLGKTDLATLSREEWLKFLKTVLTSYGDEMRSRLS